MEYLYDISKQLMKPVKDLAHWNIPLAEMLQTYIQLTNELEDFDEFSEGGLIVQNSANVYGKRVEILFAEALSLTSSLLTQQEENKANSKESKKSTRKINFDDFELVEIETKVTNLKEDNIKKAVKLLPKQFIQVEKRLPESLTETMIDIHGDVIGKKYAFRCNENVNIYGMLTDEITLEDFHEIEMPITSPEDDILSGICNLTEAQNNTEMQDSGFGTQLNFDDDITDNMDDNHSISEHCDQNDSMFDHGKSAETTIDKSSDQIHSVNETNSTIQDSVLKKPNLETIQEDVEITEEKSEDKIEESVQTASEKKRNKKENQINANKSWEPIPFDEGIPDKLPRRKRKVPPCLCDVKTKQMRKRKAKDNDSLTDLLRNEEPVSKEKDVENPATQIFSPIRRDELEEFKKSFEMCLGSHFADVISTMTMEFEPNFGNRNLPLDSPAYSTNMDDIDLSLEPGSPNIPDNYTPPTSPEDFDGFDQTVEPSKTVRNYDEIVRKKIKDVQKRRNRTALEETVARWHETIKPKLDEAEKQETFEINTYGSSILSKLSQTTERKMLLSDMVRNQPAFQVARFFSASLQLACEKNVEIKPFEDARDIEIHLMCENRSKAIDYFNLPRSSKRK